MKYKDQDLSEYTKDELINISLDLASTRANRAEKKENARYKKIMKNQPVPVENPAFTELVNAINEEIGKRN